MPTLNALQSNRAQIMACAARHGAMAVRIFGSVSRGEEKEGSDIDFLVRFENDRSLLDHVGLIQDLAALLGVKVDVVSEDGLSPYLREQVLADAVPL